MAFAADAGVESAVALVKRLLGEDATTRVLVFCGAQSEEHAEPLEALLALKDRHIDRLSLSFVMDRESGEAELLRGRLDADKIDALASKLFDAKAVREYHVYGPAELGDDVIAALTKLGVDTSRIHRAPVRDRSTLSTPSSTSPPKHRAPAARSGATTPSASAKSIESVETGAPAARAGATTSTAPNTAAIPTNANDTRVSFVMDGRRRSFSMHTNSESILDAAARSGIDLPFSCKAGVCSTCRTKLIRGEVEMRENYALEDWELEQGFILACQSHAKTPEIELNYDEK